MAVVAQHSALNVYKHCLEEEQHLINVFLKMWDGQTLCCVIDPRKASISHVEMLKQRVLHEYPDLSKEKYYFESNGKVLAEKSVDSVAWKNGMTIFVQFRNRGGCFIISFSILMIILMAIIGSFCTCGSSLLIVPVLLPFLFILPLFCL